MDISLIAVWPFYLTKKESLNFSRGEASIAWSTQWHADFISPRGTFFSCLKGEVMKSFSVL
jgi:hypothetical protein